MTPGLKSGFFALLLYWPVLGIAGSISSPGEALRVLERRQSTCPTTSPVSCTAIDPKLPGNFCCGAGTSCISIDSSSSALCCPNNGPCTAIEPINCDVALQNPQANQASGPIFTTRLNDQLPVCGNACCPFGYTCAQRNDGSSICQLVTSKAISAPPNAATTAPSGGTPTSNPPTNSAPAMNGTTATVQPSGIDSTKPQSSTKSNPFPPGVFLAGLFPGLLIGALGVLAWVILTGRLKKQNQDGDQSRASTYARGGEIQEISGPTQDTATNRSDFVRRTKTIGRSAKSMFSKKDPNGGTPGLPFDNADQGWRNLTPPENKPVPAGALGRQIPVGPYAQMDQSQDREPSLRYPSGTPGVARGTGEFPQTPGYRASASTPGYPATPVNRNTAYTNTDDPTGEIIRIYTPPNAERPSAAIAPVRGMSSQRRSQDSGIGGGYEFDDEKGGSFGRSSYPTRDDDKSVYEPSNYETLTPARYDGGGSQKRTQKTGSKERPETTFTDMLRAINFPDPIRDDAPALPAIPKQFR